MNLPLSGTLPRDEWLQGMELALTRMPGADLRRWLASIVAALAVSILLMLAMRDALGRWPPLWACGLAILAAGLAAAAAPWLVRQVVRLLYRSLWKSFHASQGHVEGLVNDDGIRLVTTKGEGFRRWDGYVAGASGERAAVLWQNERVLEILPRRWFASEEDWATFCARVAELPGHPRSATKGVDVDSSRTES